MATKIMVWPKYLSTTTYIVISIVGLFAFLLPFLQPQIQFTESGIGHTQDAPIFTLTLVFLCLMAMLLDAQSNMLNAKTVALLGVLLSINTVIRFVEVAIPGPGGVTPVFFLIMVAGFVFGPRFGMLMGCLSLLTSAFVTGGVGPWLPFQMFTAGWMGLSAGLLGRAVRRLENKRLQLVALVVFAALWGFLYGAIMNVWFWPFADNPIQQSWRPGMSLGEVIDHYLLFYSLTSLTWDAFGAAGNGALMVAFGGAAIGVLDRAHKRFEFAILS